MPNEPTEVIPLDELMDMASEPSTAPTVQMRSPVAPTPTPTPAPTPAPAPLNPAIAQPVAQRPAAQRPVARPDLGAMLEQSGEKLAVAGEQFRDWLRLGDNGLIAATALVALLLIVVVASL